MKLAIVMAILAVFVLSGCTTSNNSGGKAFIGGTEGLRT
jgi:hypothetical protein